MWKSRRLGGWGTTRCRVGLLYVGGVRGGGAGRGGGRGARGGVRQGRGWFRPGPVGARRSWRRWGGGRSEEAGDGGEGVVAEGADGPADAFRFEVGLGEVERSVAGV